MKLAYITSLEENEGSGVYKKVRNHIDGLKLNDIEVHLIECAFVKKWKKAIPFGTRSFEWDSIEIPKDVDAIYIRYQLSDYRFIKAISRWRKQFPGTKIILEIPTYPYDDEVREMSNIVTQIRDKHYRRHIHKYVDRIVTCTPFESIFGTQTIYMINGINVDEISPKCSKGCANGVNIIAVASANFSHGYDRLLEGIKAYYEDDNHTERVIFHLVGDGNAVPMLQRYVFDNGLSSYVIFHGFKSGKELDDLYESANIAVDVLGGHRKGDAWFGTLKSREYLCKGIPFITEYELPAEIEPVEKYILRVPADETPIDIDEIIDFYNKTVNDYTAMELRGFAYRYCDISVAMEPLVKYLKETQR